MFNLLMIDQRHRLRQILVCLFILFYFINSFIADGKTLVFKPEGMSCEQILKHLEYYAPPSPPPATPVVSATPSAKKVEKKSDTTKKKK